MRTAPRVVPPLRGRLRFLRAASDRVAVQTAGAGAQFDLLLVDLGGSARSVARIEPAGGGIDFDGTRLAWAGRACSAPILHVRDVSEPGVTEDRTTHCPVEVSGRTLRVDRRGRAAVDLFCPAPAPARRGDACAGRLLVRTLAGRRIAQRRFKLPGRRVRVTGDPPPQPRLEGPSAAPCPRRRGQQHARARVEDAPRIPAAGAVIPLCGAAFDAPPRFAAWEHREARQRLRGRVPARGRRGLPDRGPHRRGRGRRGVGRPLPPSTLDARLGDPQRAGVGPRGRRAGASCASRLTAPGAGRSTASRPRHLDGCLDVDLESSSLTNAFPVHRLGLEIGRGGRGAGGLRPRARPRRRAARAALRPPRGRRRPPALPLRLARVRLRVRARLRRGRARPRLPRHRGPRGVVTSRASSRRGGGSPGGSRGS